MSDERVLCYFQVQFGDKNATFCLFYLFIYLFFCFAFSEGMINLFEIRDLFILVFSLGFEPK